MSIKKIQEFTNTSELESYINQSGAMLQFENGVMLCREDLHKLLSMFRPNDMFRKNFLINGTMITPEQRSKMGSDMVLEAIGIQRTGDILVTKDHTRLFNDECESMTYQQILETIDRRKEELQQFKEKYPQPQELADDDQKALRNLLRKIVAGVATNKYVLLSGDEYNDMFTKRKTLQIEFMDFVEQFSNQTIIGKVLVPENPRKDKNYTSNPRA